MVYYSKKMKIKISKGKRQGAGSRSHLAQASPCPCPLHLYRQCWTLLTTMCDNMHRGLPTGEANLSLGSRVFTRVWSCRPGWLTTRQALSLHPPQRSSCLKSSPQVTLLVWTNHINRDTPTRRGIQKLKAYLPGPSKDQTFLWNVEVLDHPNSWS